MTRVRIEPGICRFHTVVTAQKAEDEDETIRLKVSSGCEAVKKMMEALGDTVDAFEVCLVKPGQGPLYTYAAASFPVHAGCPVIAGITKCIEAEAGLALKCDAGIRFLDGEAQE